MTAFYEAQYENTLGDMGARPLVSEDQIPATSGEGIAAAFRYTRDELLINSRGLAFGPLVAARSSAITGLLGHSLGDGVYHSPDTTDAKYVMARRLIASGGYDLDDKMDVIALTPEARQYQNSFTPGFLRSMVVTERYSRLYPDLVKSDDQIIAEVEKTLAAKRERNSKIMGRAPGWSVFAGTAVGMLTDPVVLATMPFGAGWIQGEGIIANALKAFGSEFLIGAGTEAAMQAEVYQFKQSIKSPYTKAEAFTNIAAAGVGAGLLRATVGAGIDVGVAMRTASRTRAEREAIIDALDQAGVPPEYVERILQETEDRAATQPPGATLEEHSAAVDDAMEAVTRGEPPEVEFDPFTPKERPGMATLDEEIAVNDELREALKEMRSQAGDMEVGGRVIRRENDTIGGGAMRGVMFDREEIERTVWGPRAEWWADRPSSGMTVAQVQKAIDKALAGERLGPRQREMVEDLVDVAKEQGWAKKFDPLDMELEGAGLRADGPDRVDAADVARAAELDEDRVAALADRFEDDDAAFMAGIREILDEQRIARREARTGGQGRERAAENGIDRAYAEEIGEAIDAAAIEQGYFAAAIAKAEDLDLPAAPRVAELPEALTVSPEPVAPQKAEGAQSGEPAGKAEGEAPEGTVEVDQKLADVPVVAGERADGTLDTRPLKEVMDELNDELAAISRVETCMSRS